METAVCTGNFGSGAASCGSNDQLLLSMVPSTQGFDQRALSPFRLPQRLPSATEDLEAGIVQGHGCKQFKRHGFVQG